MSFLKQE